MNLTPGIFTNGISAGSGQSDEAAQLIAIRKFFHPIDNLQKGKELLLQISSMSVGKYLNTTYLVGCKLVENTLQ